MPECKDCKWFDREGESDKSGCGYCHRHPPTVNNENLEGEQVFTCKPVYTDGWCGEFKDRNSQNLKDDFPISILDLSTRAQNCLEWSNIRTIGELRQKSRSNLLDIRNFGNTCLREVKRKLADIGVVLFNNDSNKAKT